MEETINKNAERLLNDLVPFLAPVLTELEMNTMRRTIHTAIKHTVADTGSYINTVLHESVVKSQV